MIICKKHILYSKNFTRTPLDTRKEAIEREISSIAERILFKGESRPNLQIHTDFFTMPCVRKNSENGISIALPPMFLLETEDLLKNRNVWENLMQSFSPPFTRKELGYLAAFQEYIQNPELSKKAKTFTLAHEISHIALDHLSFEWTHEESQANEFAADRLAAESIPDALEGGIYLLEILNKYLPKQPAYTHPPLQERIAQLKSLS